MQVRVLPRSSCSCDRGASQRTAQAPRRTQGCGALSRQRFHRVECVDSGLGVSRWSWEHPLEPGGCSSHVSWIQDEVCCWPYPCAGKNASAGNRTRVTSMATMYSTTRPLMLATMPSPNKLSRVADHHTTMTQTRRRNKNASTTHRLLQIHLARIELATFSVLG